MNAKTSKALERLKTDFARVTGAPFQHFACPMLFLDEDVPLCQAHIVNVAFRDSSRRWTIQRRDVDNFFGSMFEADFADVQHNADGIAPRALVDRTLHHRLRPQITFEGKEVDYFVGRGPVPDSYTAVRFGHGHNEVQLALKMKATDIASSAGSDWHVTVEKDVTVQAVVSVLKAAHLTLFAMYGYSYALSRSGHFLGAHLGSFFAENRGKAKSDIVTTAAIRFAPLAALVRPVKTEASPLRGTIDDGYAQMCWLEDATPARPWAMIVFVRTAQLVSAALVPMLEDKGGAQRFRQLLERGADRFVTSMARFRGDHWDVGKDRTSIDWPAASFG